jgi:hypothetical protein
MRKEGWVGGEGVGRRRGGGGEEEGKVGWGGRRRAGVGRRRGWGWGGCGHWPMIEVN